MSRQLHSLIAQYAHVVNGNVPIDGSHYRAAGEVVCRNATDSDDARLLLAMVGIEAGDFDREGPKT